MLLYLKAAVSLRCSHGHHRYVDLKENDDCKEFAVLNSHGILHDRLIIKPVVAVITDQSSARLPGGLVLRSFAAVLLEFRSLRKSELMLANLESCHDLAQFTKHERGDGTARSYAPAPPTNLGAVGSRIWSEKKGTSTAM